jgi:hypothetical protein
MGKLVIIALCAAAFAAGAVAPFEIVPVRSACAAPSCHFHIAGG